MAILEVLTVPHPILAKKARAVAEDEFGPELQKLCSDMAETMYAAPGVGLAAPQVGDSRCILVVDTGGEDMPHARGERLLFMVNPEFVEMSKETITWNESCLSVPEFDGDVKRSFRVRVRWQDPLDGAVKDDVFEEYEAVVIQHESDHLEGTVILDHMSRFKRMRYLKKVARKKPAYAK